ncbi:unnamed protein product, partial [Iphiclides podalirius]
MSVAERSNAATFIQFTTVKPFSYMGSTFKCFYCTQYYPEFGSLLEHTSTHQIDDRETILNRHIPRGKRFMLADVSNLQCRLCEQHHQDLDAVRRHLEMEHGKRFRPAGNGMTEYKVAAQDGPLKCHMCEDTFHSFALLSAHVYRHVGKVVCERCGAGFPNQHLLSKHTETHLTERFGCKHCDRVFAKRSQRKYHTDTVHLLKDRVKPKKCHLCSLTFKEHHSKMLHLKRAHGLARSFNCHVCNAVFVTRRALTDHTTKTHTEKFKCETCSKCFAVSSKLKQHVVSHSGERSFVCPVCNKPYMHKTTLRKHMRSHTAASEASNDAKFKLS